MTYMANLLHWRHRLATVGEQRKAWTVAADLAIDEVDCLLDNRPVASVRGICRTCPYRRPSTRGWRRNGWRRILTNATSQRSSAGPIQFVSTFASRRRTHFDRLSSESTRRTCSPAGAIRRCDTYRPIHRSASAGCLVGNRPWRRVPRICRLDGAIHQRDHSCHR